MAERILRITLIATEDETHRLVALIRTDPELFDALTQRLLADVNGQPAQPPAPAAKLRRNGLEFANRADYEQHRKFYKQAMVDVEWTLRTAANGGEL